jgi:uncharacterized protein YndB with AHSA1/START domain
MNQQTSETAIRKTVTVSRPVEEAFRIFTEEIAEWWPYGTHSVEQENVDTVILECRPGGRFYERAKDGTEHSWGTVLSWDPPRRVVYSWHPGRGEETAQEVEIAFTAVADGTRVELLHTGWEVLGDRMAEVVASYDTGWDTVLGHFAKAANA